MAKRQKEKEIDPEILMKQKFKAKCRFRALVRLGMANAYWLIEDSGYDGDDVKRRIEQAVRGKKKKLLNIDDKSLLNKPAEERTDQEKKYIYRKIGGLKCFKRYPNHVKKKLAAWTYFKYYGPNRVIVRQHHEAHAMYFIVSGKVIVSQDVYDEIIQQYVSVVIDTMSTGDMFGEVSLLHNIPRTATVTTSDHCEFLALMKEDFKNILLASVQRQWDEIQQAMAMFSYFDGLDDVSRQEGCIVARLKKIEPNEIILGDDHGVPNHVYFVIAGECQMIELLKCFIVKRLGKTYYTLCDTFVPPDKSEEDLDKKYSSSLFKRLSLDESGTGIRSSVKSTKSVESKGGPVSLKSILYKRSSGQESKRVTVDNEVLLPPRSKTKSRIHISQSDSTMVKGFNSHIAASNSQLQSIVNSIQKINFESKTNDLIRERSSSSKVMLEQALPNLKEYFMQVLRYYPGSTFGFGENMRDRRIVALTPVLCMLIPKVWLLQHNTANIWTRVEHYLNRKATSTVTEQSQHGPRQPSSLATKKSTDHTSCPEYPMGVRQNPWTPTKRRGIIAAETNSPGPAVVSLPSLIGKPPPESRKARAPAFTFGYKFDRSGKIVGPGPARYSTWGMTSKAPNMYTMPPVLGEAKEGSKRAAPAYSIIGRPKSLGDKNNIPGPGTYTLDKSYTVVKNKPPSYSMAPRRSPPASTVPGPGAYCSDKDTMIHHERSTSSTRRKMKSYTPDQVPAPNAYCPEKADKVLRAKSPAFTFRTKTELIKVHDAPAPNVYSPEKSLNSLNSGPKYTLAGKGVAEKHDVSPAPNAYDPQKADKILHEKSPAYTIPSKIVVEKIEQTPAPNVYSPEKSMHMLNGGPKYTISGKVVCTKISDTPAPNSYEPQKADKVLHESSPSYSFRIKEQTIVRSDSPAPNMYSPEKSIHMLDSTPKFTISGKGHTEKPEITPAPNAYCPENSDKILHESSPAFSFRTKDQLHKPDDTPAPNNYAPEKSFKILDGSPKFTIAGKGTSPKIDYIPGPNVYCPDKADKLLHESSPAYTFRQKNSSEIPDNTPAPNVYDPHLLDSAPKFSMYGRRPDGKISDTPGPCAYDPHLLNGTPKYTMAGRGPGNKIPETPGPNYYDPHLPESSPKYTICGKGPDAKISNVPAPNAYDPHLPDGTPKFTISGRGPSDKPSDVPGPNAYDPHLSDSAPKFTMAGKGPDSKFSNVPAPNAYDPHLLDGTPKFTIAGKGLNPKVSDVPAPNAYNPHLPDGTPKFTIAGKGPDSKISDIPAPNAYDPRLSDGTPKFTIAGKGHESKVFDVPAPNTYDPHLPDGTLSFTIAGKGPDAKVSDVPAPNAYDPSKYHYMLDGVPKYSFGIKRPEPKQSNYPAPTAYNPEKADKILYESIPSYTFRPKADSAKIVETPGPGFYDPEKADKILLDNSPRYSFRIKTKGYKPDDTPAPNCYNPDKADKVMLHKAPEYTFRIKTNDLKVPDTPAPNSYTLPATVKTPLYTISGRHKDPIDERLKVPAPGSYNPEKGYKFVLTYSPQYTFGIKIHTEKYLETPAPNTYRIPSVLDTPVYTLSGRHKVPVDDRVRFPAPGTYSPEKVQLNRTPQITFGIKHSPLLGQLKPIEPLRPTEKNYIQKSTTQSTKDVSKTTQELNANVTQSSGKLTNGVVTEKRVSDTNEDHTRFNDSHVHITQVRAESDIRSSTESPEPVQETLTQELVWVSQKPIRRGSYTIDKSDAVMEKFQNCEIIPIQNGNIQTATSCEKEASLTQESSNHIDQREGFEQRVQKNVQNKSAQEKSQTSSEQVQTGTEVQHLPNGGISKTTTTTTVKKIGTAARTAKETTAVSRTATVVTSVGTKSCEC